MSYSKILRLGDMRLYQVSELVREEEVELIKPDIEILHNALMEFREMYGTGRAVAAPQIALFKRFIYFHVDQPIVIINPMLSNFSKEKMIVWDDCLCFPDLLVKVERSKRVTLTFRDLQWQENKWELTGDLSELIQHEYDHLDGILATQRAIDKKSFRLR